MHVWFRQYAQQMGMQNVRAILPEQIDVLINTAISDIVNQLVRENVGTRNNRVITDNSKIGQINALRSLYKVKELPMTGADTFMEFSQTDSITGKMSNKTRFGNNVSQIYRIPDYLYLVDFAINYIATTTGYTGYPDTPGAQQATIDSKTAKATAYFPVRLIEEAYLADTLNDYILKQRIRTPIIVVYNNDTFDLYVDEFKLNSSKTDHPQEQFYTLENNIVPYMFKVSYIAKPNKVRYAIDIGGQNVDCDLPESMHVDILKHAVDLYNVSITGNTYNSQQNQQVQQREMVRNENRPINEGYQN